MTKILIIGSGRWAHHLEKSLALAGVTHTRWARKTHNEDQLVEQLETASHVWLAISDTSLGEWVPALPELGFRGLILHSSGALEIPGAHSVHPLMSFGPHLYPDDFYPRYAFVTTSSLSHQELIPGLPNPLTHIPLDKKTFYHAMCVLGGNGSVLLWQKFLFEMRQMGISTESSTLYVQRVCENLLTQSSTALTGPLVRQDQITLQKDLEAMTGDPFQTVLAAMIVAYRHQGKELL